MTKVLITGAGALLGQEIFQSLKHSRSFDNLFIGFADPSASAVGLYWADASHQLPLAVDDSYISSLIDLLKLHDYNFLIPGTDVELPKISYFRDRIELESGCKVIISMPNVIDVANDKYLTSLFLKNHGYQPPLSWTPDTLINEDLNSLPYPLIVKPRDGARSIGVSKVNNSSELTHSLNSTTNPIIQECIGTQSDEYTAGTITFNSRCYGSIILKRTLRDGNTWTAQVVNDLSLQESISSIAESLNPYGPCNFQFRLDSFGRPRVFEINARFSGTTYMRTLSGFDEVVWSLMYASDGVLPGDLPTVFNDLYFMRSFSVTSIPSTSILN